MKNSELPDGDPNKKWKYCVVFLGDRVRTQHYEQAFFLTTSEKLLLHLRQLDAATHTDVSKDMMLSKQMLNKPTFKQICSDPKPG